MKTITIGDLHGLENWKTVDPEKYDKIIFLGDYLDSETVGDEDMVRNFTEIIAFKYEMFFKVILLIGNHEVSYLDSRYQSMGWRPFLANIMVELLLKYSDVFKIAWQYKNYLWSHAGVHSGFYKQKIQPRVIDSNETLADTLQRLYEEGYPPIFEISHERGGSRKFTGGPLWLDKKLLIKKPLKGYHQIVGHIPVDTIKHYGPYPKDPETSVILCDCIEYGDGKMYELEV